MAPGRAEALADEVTTFVHGAEETEHAKAAAAALFGGGDLHGLSPTTLAAALREAGSTRWRRCSRRRPPGRDGARQEQGRGPPHDQPRAVPTSTTCGSRIPTPSPGRADLIGGAWLVLRRGKKNFAGVEVG